MNERDFERREKARLDAMYDAQFADEPTSDVDYADKRIIAKSMTDRELMQMALDCLLAWEEESSGYGWSISDQECVDALRARLVQPVQNDEKGKPMTYWGGLAQPEPEPVDKAGSPCKEFWDWLPKAYRDGDKGEDAKFTKYNMEVAYLAGKQSQLEQEPTARDINEVILNSIHDSSEVVAQPQREWCQCKDAPNDCTYEKNCRVPQIDAAFKRIEWQGLTDDEITETLKRFGLGERAALARAIEAKLKEKNG